MGSLRTIFHGNVGVLDNFLLTLNVSFLGYIYIYIFQRIKIIQLAVRPQNTPALVIIFGSQNTISTIFTEFFSVSEIYIMRKIQAFLLGAFSPLDYIYWYKSFISNIFDVAHTINLISSKCLWWKIYVCLLSFICHLGQLCSLYGGCGISVSMQTYFWRIFAKY